MHTQPQPNPQSTSPVRLIENHQNGKGVLGQTKKKPAHGKKSKNPSPGLSPRVLHEPTYSADERRARQFSEGSPRCAAEAIVAVVLGHLVCLPLCLAMRKGIAHNKTPILPLLPLISDLNK